MTNVGRMILEQPHIRSIGLPAARNFWNKLGVFMRGTAMRNVCDEIEIEVCSSAETAPIERWTAELGGLGPRYFIIVEVENVCCDAASMLVGTASPSEMISP